MLPFKVIFLIFHVLKEARKDIIVFYVKNQKKKTKKQILIAYCPLAGEKGRNVVLKKKKKKMQGWLRHIDKHTHD